MPTTFELKTWPQYFRATWTGKKLYEYRKDDRGFEVGDYLVLREFDPSTGEYSGFEIMAQITHKLSGSFDLPSDMCILGLSPYIERRDTQNRALEERRAA